MSIYSLYKKTISFIPHIKVTNTYNITNLWATRSFNTTKFNLIGAGLQNFSLTL